MIWVVPDQTTNLHGHTVPKGASHGGTLQMRSSEQKHHPEFAEVPDNLICAYTRMPMPWIKTRDVLLSTQWTMPRTKTTLLVSPFIYLTESQRSRPRWRRNNSKLLFGGILARLSNNSSSTPMRVSSKNSIRQFPIFCFVYSRYSCAQPTLQNTWHTFACKLIITCPIQR